MRRLALSFALPVVAALFAGGVEAGCILEVHGSFSAYRCEDGSAGRSDDLGRLPPEASRLAGTRGWNALGFRDVDEGVAEGARLALPDHAARAAEHGWVKASPW